VSLSTNNVCSTATNASCNNTTIPAAGSISASFTSDPLGSGITGTVTLYVNGVSTGNTCSIPANGNACSSPIVANVGTNDKIEVSFTTSAAANNKKFNTATTLTSQSQGNAHVVQGSGTAATSSLTVTLPANLAFTNAGTYSCYGQDTPHNQANVGFTYTDGSHFTLTYSGGGSTATDAVTWQCEGF
jgi:hypothetical protein